MTLYLPAQQGSFFGCSVSSRRFCVGLCRIEQRARTERC